MRALPFLLVAAGALAPIGTALAEQAHTTRIETKPYYGAVISIEHGVRVIRPIPPTDHLIINPNGATPLILGGNGGVSVSPEAPAEPGDKPEPADGQSE
jgi:hypothetical protein